MNLEQLKEQIEAVTTNLTIYINDLERYTNKLMDNYGLEPSEAKQRIDEIDEEIEKELVKLKKLERKIKKALGKIDGRTD